MGTFISSQTVCKVLEISDVILGKEVQSAAWSDAPFFGAFSPFPYGRRYAFNFPLVRDLLFLFA